MDLVVIVSLELQICTRILGQGCCFWSLVAMVLVFWPLMVEQTWFMAC